MVTIQRWTLFNLLFRQVHREDLLRFVCKTQSIGRNQNQPVAQPASRIGNEVAHRPIFVIEVELLGFADVTITRSECEIFEFFGLS